MAGTATKSIGGPAAGGTVPTVPAGAERSDRVWLVGVYNMIAPEIGGRNPTVTIFRSVKMNPSSLGETDASALQQTNT